MSNKKKSKTAVKIVKSKFDTFTDPIYSARTKIEKSDKTEQLDEAARLSASEWVSKPYDMYGLEAMVQHSTILPQCIKAYSNNIAGFGLEVKYKEDIEDTSESLAEWDKLSKILDLLNLETDTKKLFEDIIDARETYGVGYLECIRNIEGDVVEINFIQDTKSIDMTYPLEPYIDMDYIYKGELINRKKKFRKFKQTVGGKTVYFKEFGDPRVMNKTDGEYLTDGEVLDIDMQANEMLDFTMGRGYYGTPRWIGQTLTVDGDYRAEKLNNNYFRNGRHTPLMIMIQGGTLSDESFEKLQSYMNEIKGENGQHAFIILETEKNETTTAFADDKQPTIQVKDMASILQTDGLFQEYQEKGRRKVQSSFLLPDLYTGYTTDFNRSTAQMAMEITEKQVFQPERRSLAWIINNKLLNGYGFKYVEAGFKAPDMTNPDDISKILTIAEKAGGVTLNDAREIARETLGKTAEEYPQQFDMNDIGNVPLAVLNTMAGRTSDITGQLQQQITKAEDNQDNDIVAVLKEVRSTLIRMGGEDDE